MNKTPENCTLVAFVVSLNLKRRHLSSSQKAVVALAMLPFLQEEARERQLAAGAYGSNGGRGNKREETLPEIFPEGFGNNGESREYAAKIVGTNRQYITDAKRLVQSNIPVLMLFWTPKKHQNGAKCQALGARSDRSDTQKDRVIDISDSLAAEIERFTRGNDMPNMRDQAAYNAAVMAARAAMNDAAETKSARPLLVRQPRTGSPAVSREADALERLCLDLDDEQTDRVWDKYVDYGYKAAAQWAIALKSERGLNPDGMRFDNGRLVGAPIRDKEGRPL